MIADIDLYYRRGFVRDFEFNWVDIPENTVMLGDQMDSQTLEHFLKYVYLGDIGNTDRRIANLIKEIWFDGCVICFPDFIRVFHPLDIRNLVEKYKEIYPEIFVI